MSTSGAGDIGVGFFADPGDVARLEQLLESAVTKGLRGGLDHMSGLVSANSAMSKSLLAITKAYEKLQKQAAKTFDPKTFKSATEGLNQYHSETIKLIAAVKEMGGRIQTVEKQIYQDTIRSADAARQRKVETIQATVDMQLEKSKELAAFKAAEKEKLQASRAELDATGRAQRAALDQQVISASTASKQRIAITRGAVKTIENLEKGLGVAIAGIFRTTTSAVSRVAGGISGVLSSAFKRETKEISSNNSVFKSVLTDRTTVLDRSLTKQERLVRESVTKQSAQFTRLNAITSKGVAGAVTGRGIGFGIGGLIAGVGLGTLFKNGFVDATNYTEQLNKTRVVFGQFSSEVIKFAQDAPTKLGVTKSKALEAVGTFGNLFRAIGLTESQSRDFSLSLTTLATDLASFNNASPEDAFIAIRSGLVGEQEPLRKFGVNLNEATLKAKAFELGLFSGKGVLTASAKAQAAYALILEQTTLAQGDFARTAHEGANAQRIFGASVEQFFSTVAGTVKGLVTTLAVGAIPIFTTLTNLVSGDNLSAGLNALRDGIKGVGIALGVLLAAKAGVEVIQLLGAAAKLALTPFGALVVGVTAIGAAVGILLPRSEAFRKAIGDLIDKAKSLGSTVKDFVTEQLGNLADWIVSTGIPAVIRFAQFVGGKLVTAFHATVDFVKDTVIPALKSFAGWIVDHVVPAAIDFGKMVQHWFGVGLKAVQQFWHFVEPFIRPAIEGFKDLGSAIASLFSGDFSKILSGLGSAGAGIGKVAATVGQNILGALKPVGVAILGWLKDIFSKKTFGHIADGFLDLVEAIGRFLGTHLDFVVEWAAKIGVALAAAAVVIGGRFLIGFVDGLRKSLPVIIGDIKDIFVDAFRGAFSGDIASIAILGAGGLAVFKLLGTQIGTSITSGIKTGVSGGVGFTQGLFGLGRNVGDSGVFGPVIADSKRFQAELRPVQNQLRILQSPTQWDGTRQGLRDLRAEVTHLRGNLTDAQYAGLQFRDRLKAAFSAITTAARGAVDIGRSIGVGLTVGFSNETSNLKGTFKGVIGQLRTIAESQGKTLGTYIGKGIAVGVGAALLGFVGGRAAGAQGASPLLTGLTTGVTTGAITGNPVVGAVAGTAAAIGAAFGNADKAAKDFNERVNKLASSIKSNLKKALDDGKISIDNLKLALSTEGVSDDIGQSILDSLSSKAKQSLIGAHISISDILGGLESGDLSKLKQQITDVFPSDRYGNVNPEAKAALDALNEAAKAYDKTTKDLTADQILLGAATSTTVGWWLRGIPGAGQLTIAIQAFDKAVTFIDPKIRALGGAISSMAGEGARNGSDPFHDITQSIHNFAGEAARLGHLPKLDPAFVTGAIDSVNEHITILNAELDKYLANIKIAFGGSDIQTAVNEGVVAIQAAVTSLAGIDPLSGLQVDKANAAIATQQITDEIAAVVTTGIQDGSIKGLEDAKDAVNPLLEAAIQAIVAAVPEGPARDALIAKVTGLFTDGFSAATPDILAAIATSTAAATEAVKAGLLGGVAKAVEAGGNIAMGLAAGLSGKAANVAVYNAAKALADLVQRTVKVHLSIDSPSKVMEELGKFAGEGLALGLADSTDNLGGILTNAVDDAINKTMDAAERGRRSLQATFSGLFDFGLTGGTAGPVGGIGGSVVSGITNAIQGLLSAFDSTTSTVFSTAAAWVASQTADDKGVFGPALTKAQLDILGESLFSLDPNDVIGSQNIASLTAALTAVQDAGKALLAQGASPQSVADALTVYTAQIRQQAIGLGLSSTGIDSLISQLGLSNTALADFVSGANAATTAFTDAANAAATLAATTIAGHPISNKPTSVFDTQLGAQLFSGGWQNFIDYLQHNPSMIDTLIAQLGLPADASIQDIYNAIHDKLYGTGTLTPDQLAASQARDTANRGRDQGGPYGGINPGPHDHSTDGTTDPNNQHPETLPGVGGNNFFIYPVTDDPAALALDVANKLASLAYVP